MITVSIGTLVSYILVGIMFAAVASFVIRTIKENNRGNKRR